MIFFYILFIIFFILFRVFWAKDESSNIATQPQEGCTVHVSFAVHDLETVITEETLYTLFRAYGDIDDITIRRYYRHSKRHMQYGYAFVDFFHPEHAVNAVGVLHNAVVNRVKYDCSMSRRSSSGSNNHDSSNNVRHSSTEVHSGKFPLQRNNSLNSRPVSQIAQNVAYAAPPAFSSNHTGYPSTYNPSQQTNPQQSGYHNNYNYDMQQHRPTHFVHPNAQSTMENGPTSAPYFMYIQMPGSYSLPPNSPAMSAPPQPSPPSYTMLSNPPQGLSPPPYTTSSHYQPGIPTMQMQLHPHAHPSSFNANRQQSHFENTNSHHPHQASHLGTPSMNAPVTTMYSVSPPPPPPLPVPVPIPSLLSPSSYMVGTTSQVNYPPAQSQHPQSTLQQNSTRPHESTWSRYP